MSHTITTFLGSRMTHKPFSGQTKRTIRANILLFTSVVLPIDLCHTGTTQEALVPVISTATSAIYRRPCSLYSTENNSSWCLLLFYNEFLNYGYSSTEGNRLQGENAELTVPLFKCGKSVFIYLYRGIYNMISQLHFFKSSLLLPQNIHQHLNRQFSAFLI